MAYVPVRSTLVNLLCNLLWNLSRSQRTKYLYWLNQKTGLNLFKMSLDEGFDLGQRRDRPTEGAQGHPRNQVADDKPEWNL